MVHCGMLLAERQLRSQGRLGRGFHYGQSLVTVPLEGSQYFVTPVEGPSGLRGYAT
jgi:hypothetical protein